MWAGAPAGSGQQGWAGAPAGPGQQGWAGAQTGSGPETWAGREGWATGEGHPARETGAVGASASGAGPAVATLPGPDLAVEPSGAGPGPLSVAVATPPRGRRLLTVGVGMVWATFDDDSPATPAATSSAASEQSMTGVRRAAVDQVLNQLNTSLANGDEAGFVGTVDPQADKDFLAHQRNVYAGLRALSQVATFQYTWTSERIYTAPWGAPVSPDAFTAYIELSYSFTGYDRTPVVDVIGMSFQRRAGHWYLSSDSRIDDQLPLGGRFEPWSTGAVAVSQHGRALVIGDPAHRAQNDRLARRLDAALQPVSQAWPVASWNGRVVAYSSTQKGFVQSWFGSHAATSRKIDPSGDATFEAKVRVLPADPVTSSADAFTPAAPRLVVTPYLLGRDDTYTQAVLRHELTHVALALEGSRRPPAWLVEGVAEYTGFRAVKGTDVDGVESLAQRGLRKDTWTQLRKGTWKPVLVAEDDAFYSGTEIAVDNAYTTAWFTCLYIADHYGEAKLRALYEAAARSPDWMRQDEVEASVLSSVLHTDRAGLLSATRTYARSLRSHFV